MGSTSDMGSVADPKKHKKVFASMLCEKAGAASDHEEIVK